jgi:hypothetical protein
MVVFGDGHVNLIKATASIEGVGSLITRAASDTISEAP